MLDWFKRKYKKVKNALFGEAKRVHQAVGIPERIEIDQNGKKRGFWASIGGRIKAAFTTNKMLTFASFGCTGASLYLGAQAGAAATSAAVGAAAAGAPASGVAGAAAGAATAAGAGIAAVLSTVGMGLGAGGAAIAVIATGVYIYRRNKWSNFKDFLRDRGENLACDALKGAWEAQNEREKLFIKLRDEADKIDSKIRSKLNKLIAERRKLQIKVKKSKKSKQSKALVRKMRKLEEQIKKEQEKVNKELAKPETQEKLEKFKRKICTFFQNEKIVGPEDDLDTVKEKLEAHFWFTRYAEGLLYQSLMSRYDQWDTCNMCDKIDRTIKDSNGNVIYEYDPQKTMDGVGEFVTSSKYLKDLAEERIQLPASVSASDPASLAEYFQTLSLTLDAPIEPTKNSENGVNKLDEQRQNLNYAFLADEKNSLVGGERRRLTNKQNNPYKLDFDTMEENVNYPSLSASKSS